MYPHHMLNKDVLGGGIYLRKLPDLSLIGFGVMDILRL